MATTAPLAFLGFGIIRPLQRDLKNDFATGSGAELFKARIGQILGTKARTPNAAGEVPWRTDFGSWLHLLRHLNKSEAFDHLAHAYVIRALQRWEPSVVVKNTKVDREAPKAAILVVLFDVVDATGRVTIANQEARVPLDLGAET